MAAVGDRRRQHLSEQRRQVEPLDLPGQHRLDLQPQPLGIERAEQFGRQRRGAGAQPPGFLPAAPDQKLARGLSHVHPFEPPRHHRPHPGRLPAARPRRRPGEEVPAQEPGHGVGDPVLVARNDGGMRDRQPERVPEQGGDREPVGQPADHRRFGKGEHVAPGRVARLHLQGQHEQRRHRHQQQRGGATHAPGLIDRQGSGKIHHPRCLAERTGALTCRLQAAALRREPIRQGAVRGAVRGALRAPVRPRRPACR